MKPWKTGPKDVAAYIAAFPEEVQARLQQLRALIRKVAPGAEEKISYRMPGYHLYGTYLAYFAAWKNHISFYPASNSALAHFKKDLAPYAVAKGTLRLPMDKPLPAALLRRIIRFRVKENRERFEEKRKAPARRKA